MIINYPYLPPNRTIKFVSLDNEFMQAAKQACRELSGCSWWPTGAVVVKNNRIIGRGANQGVFQPLCPRVEHHCASGEGYHFCQEQCRQIGHAEVTAINQALKKDPSLVNADLYLFGHWWCCENCWAHIIKHRLGDVFLLINAHEIFTPDKRRQVMAEITAKIKAGETVTPADAGWEMGIESRV